MIATDRFVFLHLHKSGGTFVNNWLIGHFPSAKRIGYHLPRSELPRELRSLPVIGTVRSPWSYYVSWYFFQSSKTQPNPLFNVVSDGGRSGFDRTIRTLLDLGRDDALLDRLTAQLPRGFTNRGLNLPAGKAEQIRGTDLGFYTFLHRYMYDGDPPASIVRMEEMRKALPEMIEATGATVSAQARDAIANAPAARESGHRPYTEYYDEPLRKLVRERDGEIIQRYDFRFGV